MADLYCHLVSRFGPGDRGRKRVTKTSKTNGVGGYFYRKWWILVHRKNVSLVAYYRVFRRAILHGVNARISYLAKTGIDMSDLPNCPACGSEYSYEDGFGPMKLKSEFVKKA